MRRRFVLASAVLLASRAVSAQAAYPTKPVRLVVNSHHHFDHAKGIHADVIDQLHVIRDRCHTIRTWIGRITRQHTENNGVQLIKVLALFKAQGRRHSLFTATFKRFGNFLFSIFAYGHGCV